MRFRQVLALIMAGACVPSTAPAQDQPISLQRPSIPLPMRWYAAPTVAGVRLTNSSRLHSLIRAGHLYLTVADALALAIENNLNLEVDRYGPLLADSALERAKAGGPIRGVPSASAQIASVTSGVGVNGSTVSAGLASGSGGGGGGNGGAASIQQVGAITPNLDPVLQNTDTFAHLTQPQSNTVVSQTDALVQSVRTYNSVVQQGLITGGLIQFRAFEQYLNENSPSDDLNPVSAPHLDLLIRHSLLQGFGAKLNDRSIRIAAINKVASREVFRSQLLDLVASVLNLYWDLVSARNEAAVRRHAVEITQKFYDDSKFEISIGAIARVEMPRAEAELATRQHDAAITDTNVRQREILLKEALSHTADAELEAAEIVPLDRIEVPQTDDLPAGKDLVKAAMGARPDVGVAKFRDQTSEIALAGTTNPLLPNLQVSAQTSDRGVAGVPQPGQGASPYFVGGLGTAMGQIFRHDFPNYQGAISFSAVIHNRQNQGDYGIDQLQFRQSQLQDQRNSNQIVVDIFSQVNALREARAKYSAARETRILQEQLLEADRKRTTGAAQFNTIMADQRSLIVAELSETDAMTSYAHARVSLDQALGRTLETNRISLEEGLRGQVRRESRLPALTK